MSLMNKFLDAVSLGRNDDYEDEYEEYEDEYEEEEEKKGFFSFLKRKKDEEEEIEDEAPKSNITAMSGGKSKSSKMQVCVIKPSTFEDVKEISDTLLSNCTVILNMEGIDLAVAQRIIDFMMGSCYAIDGNLQKISNYIFIITPAAVGISGDLQGLVDAFESQKLASGGSYATF